MYSENFSKVGQQYENRIGRYKVFELVADGIRIRSESETAAVITDLELQRRVVEHLSSERTIMVAPPRRPAKA